MGYGLQILAMKLAAISPNAKNVEVVECTLDGREMVAMKIPRKKEYLITDKALGIVLHHVKADSFEEALLSI